MAENRSPESPWQSKWGGGWVSSGQYLAEGMVARIAKKDGIDLPHRFWMLSRWKRVFLLQLRFANSLLKLYEPAAIVKALRTPEGKRVYSLGAKWLDPLVRDQQERLDRQEQIREAVEPVSPPPESVVEPPRPTFVEKPHLLSKLRDLD